MKNRFILLFLFSLLVLNGCESPPPNATVNKNVPELTKEQQQEQRKRWEEERKRQEDTNQHVVDTITIMIPAILQ